MAESWNRPYECDRWEVTSHLVGHTFFRKKEKWSATASGFRKGEHWCTYGLFSSEGYSGRTRKQAEDAVRAAICRDIKTHKDYLSRSAFQTNSFLQEEICPC